MLGDPATELIEQASRIPAETPYAAQQKMLVLNYARDLVAENERLKARSEWAVDAERILNQMWRNNQCGAWADSVAELFGRFKYG